MRHVLPIKSDYVPNWSVWECLREIIQNAKDEEDSSGNAMIIHHRGDWLTVTNPGATMSTEVLLLGYTEKANRVDLRGQFGEGLNLALLAGVRAGLEVTIETPHEVWRPELSREAQYSGHEVLVVATRKRRKVGDGVRVRVKITKESWEYNKRRFLFLAPPKTETGSVKTARGTVLLEDEHAGEIYVKGIFVDKRHQMRFGYDLPDAELDRDRRMINTWDLQWKLGKIYMEAMALAPDLIGPHLYTMLKDDADDITQVCNATSYGDFDEVSKQIAAMFQAEHGIDALPVRSMAESAELDHYNKKGVVVSEALQKLLQHSLGSTADLKKRLAEAPAKTYLWEDLMPGERDALTNACVRTERALGSLGYDTPMLLEQIEVVDFKDKGREGTARLDNGQIRLARKVLESEARALQVLIHEEAHTVARADDGTKSHVDLIQDIWMKVFAHEIGEEV